MKPLPLVAVAVLTLTSVGCSGESACQRYERIGAAADVNNQSGSPEEVREAVEAQVECFAEQGDRE